MLCVLMGDLESVLNGCLVEISKLSHKSGPVLTKMFARPKERQYLERRSAATVGLS